MESTTITIQGDMNKEFIVKLVKKVLELQATRNKKTGQNDMIFIHVSNNIYTDSEIRELISKNVKNREVIDLVKQAEDKLLDSTTKGGAS